MGQLVLSDNIIQVMSRRADVRKEFPFVHINTPKSGGCSCRKTSKERDVLHKEFDRIKHIISALSPEQLKRFKTLLKAEQLVMFIKTPNGVQKTVK